MRLELLLSTDKSNYPPCAVSGDIRLLSELIYNELLTSGYSLTSDDVDEVFLDAVKKYTGWARLDAQFVDDLVGNQSHYFNLSPDTRLLADEWVVIEPVVRCHCDLLQARRVEGSQSLGVQAFGISSSEANQLYTMALETMKKEAFYHEPFSIESDD